MIEPGDQPSCELRPDDVAGALVALVADGKMTAQELDDELRCMAREVLMALVGRKILRKIDMREPSALDGLSQKVRPKVEAAMAKFVSLGLHVGEKLRAAELV